jgi:hypothetical protein
LRGRSSASSVGEAAAPESLAADAFVDRSHKPLSGVERASAAAVIPSHYAEHIVFLPVVIWKHSTGHRMAPASASKCRGEDDVAEDHLNGS